MPLHTDMSLVMAAFGAEGSSYEWLLNDLDPWPGEKGLPTVFKRFLLPDEEYPAIVLSGADLSSLLTEFPVQFV